MAPAAWVGTVHHHHFLACLHSLWHENNKGPMQMTIFLFKLHKPPGLVIHNNCCIHGSTQYIRCTTIYTAFLSMMATSCLKNQALDSVQQSTEICPKQACPLSP